MGSSCKRQHGACGRDNSTDSDWFGLANGFTTRSVPLPVNRHSTPSVGFPKRVNSQRAFSHKYQHAKENTMSGKKKISHINMSKAHGWAKKGKTAKGMNRKRTAKK